MNREIKFRAWHPLLCDMFGNVVIADGKALRRGYFATDLNTDFSDKLMIMQYTGLKDKNGKEIYEGDIVKEFRKSRSFPEGKIFTRVIEWSNELTLDDMFGDTAAGFNLFSTNLEIIGNIYENPELLTEGATA
jgi:uncharacterized phage protein (TIGR01671 family)